MNANDALQIIENLLLSAPVLWEKSLDIPERKVNQAIAGAISTIATYRLYGSDNAQKQLHAALHTTGEKEEQS